MLASWLWTRRCDTAVVMMMDGDARTLPPRAFMDGITRGGMSAAPDVMLTARNSMLTTRSVNLHL